MSRLQERKDSFCSTIIVFAALALFWAYLSVTTFPVVLKKYWQWLVVLTATLTLPVFLFSWQTYLLPVALAVFCGVEFVFSGLHYLEGEREASDEEYSRRPSSQLDGIEGFWMDKVS